MTDTLNRQRKAQIARLDAFIKQNFTNQDDSIDVEDTNYQKSYNNAKESTLILMEHFLIDKDFSYDETILTYLPTDKQPTRQEYAEYAFIVITHVNEYLNVKRHYFKPYTKDIDKVNWWQRYSK